MDRILIFAGTTEGRSLAEYLRDHNIASQVCVATEYGQQLMEEGPLVKLHTGRLTEREMEALMEREKITLTVDATHPYATEVTKNILRACQNTGAEYLRLLRDVGYDTDEKCGCKTEEKDIHCVENVKEAADFLRGTRGNILVTTGSKELSAFTCIEDFRERVYARVLPSPEAVQSCTEMGFSGRHLICMQGPFTKEMNIAMMRQYGINWLVTKESGKSGGFEEKLYAARDVGARVVLIGRPPQIAGAMSQEEIRNLLRGRLCIKPNRQISLVGIGMGRHENMTMEARKACIQAQVLIGARRMLETVQELGKPTFISYKPDEIKEYIESHPEYERIAILLSGDVGFYSGAKKLLELFPREEVSLFCGISSVVYLCAKLGMSWEDVKLLSLHGRKQNIVRAVDCHGKVFALVGQKGGVGMLCRKLCGYGLGKVTLFVGQNLSYQNESIVRGTAEELQNQEFEALCVVLIENKSPHKRVAHGLADEEFLRGKVPMTKSEVRSISISKLGLKRDSVVYDVGAGTGSVAVEMALVACEGQVYAVEKKPEAVELIRKNQVKFRADNLTVVEGLAPEALEGLPAPTHVFIGGSSGNMRRILDVVFAKNPLTRVVVNAIALETVAETAACMRELGVRERDIVCVSSARAREVGDYHMMMGMNPVYILSFTGGED
ncbi:MAG: precorrin-6A reductase [Lachnospiraceae bacterium]|jgi:precorrin-6Y C5,15-methyltransferase (decarboxylating)|nr:precorrin-6A reductase [Lachnospiraceae bacterium]